MTYMGSGKEVMDSGRFPPDLMRPEWGRIFTIREQKEGFYARKQGIKNKNTPYFC